MNDNLDNNPNETDVIETKWTFYKRSHTAWDAMLRACEDATLSIDLEQFIFVNDVVGKRFLEVCRRKAREGIRVRLLCDAAGSFGFFTSTIVNDVRKDGVEVVFFNTFIPGAFHTHTWWFFRDHRKLLIVDNKVAFTGGICLSHEMRDWRDTHVEIHGEVLLEMRQAFEAMWERAHKRRKRKISQIKIGEQGFNYVTNTPRPRKRFLYYRLVDAIRTSKQYIYLTTPYFVPDSRFLRVLLLARRRKVDIRIIVPERSDHPLVDIGSRSFFTTLLKAGVKIYQYKGQMIHSKTAIIDDEWATIGSLNFDNLSFLYNFEANLISTDKRFIQDLKNHFLEDIENAPPVALNEWLQRPLTQKINEILVYPVRKFL